MAKIEKLDIQKVKIEKERREYLRKNRKGIAKYDIKALEFNWIFNENEGKQFLNNLSEAQDDSVLEVEVIKNMVQYLSKYYRRAVFFRVFLPFLVYFTMFIAYSTWINNEKNNEVGFGTYSTINLILTVLMAGFILFFLYFEIKKVIYYKFRYILNFWNMVDISSILFNTTCLVMDVVGTSERTRIPIIACATFVMWVKLVYFGRLWSKTAWLVRMVIAVVQGMKYFLIIFFVSILGFGNSFLLLARSQDEANNIIGGDGVWKSLEYSYRTGLGDFNTDNFPDTGFKNVLSYSIWMLSTFLNMLVILNAVIAIVSDIFENVYENMNKNIVKELVDLMSESELLISRKQLFGDKSYLLFIKKEASDQAAVSYESKIENIKEFMRQQSKNQEQVYERVNDNLQEYANCKCKSAYSVHYFCIYVKPSFCIGHASQCSSINTICSCSESRRHPNICGQQTGDDEQATKYFRIQV